MAGNRVAATLGVALLAATLTGCSSALSSPAVEACNHVDAWLNGGQPDDALPDVLENARASLARADEPRLSEALAVLENVASGDAVVRVAAAEAFRSACFDRGWDYPEG